MIHLKKLLTVLSQVSFISLGFKIALLCSVSYSALYSASSGTAVPMGVIESRVRGPGFNCTIAAIILNYLTAFTTFQIAKVSGPKSAF
jgi:hypothetical protein